MNIDNENLYRQLGRLIQTMPDLTSNEITDEVHLWLGKAYVLVKEVNNGADAAMFIVQTNSLGTVLGNRAAREIKNIIFRSFALAEMHVPAGASGAFIPVGEHFDAYAALLKILQTAKEDILIIDPYMDGTVLLEFGTTVPENTNFRLLTDKTSFKPDLITAAQKWNQQYGSVRPLSVRLAPARTLHDRAIFIDRSTAWTLTQSLKDFAKRSPAEIIKANDTATLKIAAYQLIWDKADNAL